MIFDPRTNQHSTQAGTEKKSFMGNPNTSFPEFLSQGGNGDLSAYAAIQLYIQAMPLFNAISLRAELFSQIPLRVQDSKTKGFVEDHPVLELLNSPNADVSQMEYLEQVCSFYDITGDSFMVATGRIHKPPLELATIPPQNVTFGASGGKFGMLHVPDTLWVTSVMHGRTTFKATEEMDMGIRFVTDSEDKELWHLRTFNPLRSSTYFRGLSRAKPLWTELQQYLSGNMTNLSMLKRGTKLSLAWVNNRGEELTDTQWSRLQEEAQKYAGDANAGGTPVLDGVDVKAIQQTNREMEYSKLQEAMYSRVSTVYRVPLALLLAQSMTLNNLETSLLQLFDIGVLPLADRIYDEMTRFLMPRYDNSENLRITYSETDITALQARLINTAKNLKDINVNTDNELRTVIGYDSAGPAGDVLYKPATLLPVDTLLNPVDDEEGDEEDEVPTPGSKFRQLLRERGYSEQVIEQMAKDHDL